MDGLEKALTDVTEAVADSIVAAVLAKLDNIPRDDEDACDIAAVLAMLDVGETTFKRIRRDPKQGFPQPFQIGKSPRWFKGEIRAWMSSRRRVAY